MKNAPWTIDSRHEENKVLPHKSMQTIMRQSFIQVLNEYAQHCSVAGVKQMTEPDIKWNKRCLWLLIFSALFSLHCYFLNYSWMTSMGNTLILMPQYSTYTIANIDFPAIALCNVNRISLKALKNRAAILYKSNVFGNVSLEHIEEYLLNSGRLIDFSYLDTSDPPFSNIERILEHSHDFDSRKIVDTMEELAPSCSEMLLRCAWLGETVDCMSIFQTRRTAKGHCCAFNYVLKFDEYGYPNGTLKAKRQVLPSYAHGLNVIVDPMLYDYAYPINYVQGFDVLLFEPTHFADPSAGRVVHRLSEPNRVEFLELKSIKQTASPEVRKYPQSIRNCIFQDEKPEDFHGVYSYSSCIMRCRVKSYLSLCQCTPYFLPMGKDEGPVCLLSDLACLHKYKEKLSHLQPSRSHSHEHMELEDSLHCSECLPDCEHTRHITKSYKTSFNLDSIDKYFAYGFTHGINMSDKSLLSIYYASPGGDLERLDVVSYWFEIVSSIGGFGGVLIGISVFSLVEIVYFLILRYSQEIYKKYTEC